MSILAVTFSNVQLNQFNFRIQMRSPSKFYTMNKKQLHVQAPQVNVLHLF